jgi:glycerophosphoryl diester phosphodiesterase
MVDPEIIPKDPQHCLPLIIGYRGASREAPENRRLCEMGVDSIMTNRPGWLRQRLREAPAP